MSKRAFLIPVAAMTVLALTGAGCSGSSSTNTSTSANSSASSSSSSSYAVTPTGSQTPVAAANTNWIQMAYAAQAKSCEGVKAYFAADMRATITEADCAAIFAYFTSTDLTKIVMVDWEKSTVSADAKTVTVVDTKGKTFVTYTLGADGNWYLNSKFW